MALKQTNVFSCQESLSFNDNEYVESLLLIAVCTVCNPEGSPWESL